MKKDDAASKDAAPSTTTPSSRSPESYDVMAAPALRTAWLLRLVAVCAAIATAYGVLVLPGIHGTFAEDAVVRLERWGGILSYGMGVLLVLALVLGAFDLARAHAVPPWARVVAILASVGVVGMFIPACATRLPPVASIILALAASAAAGSAAAVGLRSPATRAVSGVLVMFTASSAIRLMAWALAITASARASTGMWDLARGVASAAVVIEAFGQMAATVWLGVRCRWVGQLTSALALALAFVIVWMGSRGDASAAPSWQLMLHTSLTEVATGTPPPYGLGTVAAFLSVVAATLALGTALQPRVLGAVAATVALALISRGAFDVPLRALAGTVAAIWVLVTISDDRAMWRVRIEDRASTPPSTDAPASS